MAFEIKIYGEIVSDLEAWGNPPGYWGLKKLQDALSEANGDDVLVRINSIGGEVSEGFSMYSELRRYAEKNKSKVVTLAEGMCASIATIIFLAGDERIVTEHTSPFIHNAWTYIWESGTSKSLRKIADDIDKVDKMIAKHYAKHTELTEEEALFLMGDDTYISPDECVAIRFATHVEEIFMPLNKKISNRLKKNNMSNKNKGGLLERLGEFLNSKNNGTPKNDRKGASNKVVSTADGSELDFYELDKDETPQVGDFAYDADGGDAEGAYAMPSGETYHFDNGDGSLTSIDEAEEDEGEDDTEALNALKKKYKNVCKKLADEKKKNAEMKPKAEAFDALESEFAASEKKNSRRGNSSGGKEESSIDANKLRDNLKRINKK